MLLSMKLAESSNLEILMRGLGDHKEVGVVWMWSDIYRDRGEYIWTDVPLQTVPNLSENIALIALKSCTCKCVDLKQLWG
jgi:hypothetical protein